MARMIDADVASKVFRGWLEGPHEASEYNSGFDDAIYRVLDVIDHMPTISQPNEWVSRVLELDELYTKLQTVTGFTAEQLLEIFAAGYTLEKPDYSKSFEEMARLAETISPNEPERAGLYGKYTVLKNEDDSLVTDCFVLRPAKDPAAVAALRAYAATTDNAELADGIINWVGVEPNEPLTLEELSLCNDPVWIKRIGDEDLSGDGWVIVEGPRCLTWHNRIPVSWEIRVWWPGSEVEDFPKYENYSKTWIAYRRPPEGEEEP